MRLLQLIHPKFGICAQNVVHSDMTPHRIKTNWKYKYGKKFFDCSIQEIEVTDPKGATQKYNKKVVDTYSDVTYSSAKEAAKKIGVSLNRIYSMCNGDISTFNEESKKHIRLSWDK